MASENETAAEAIAAERHRIECAKADAEDLEIECEFTDEEVVAIIDRIESAYKREVAELRACLAGALEVVDSTVVNLGIAGRARAHEDYRRWRKALGRS